MIELRVSQRAWMSALCRPEDPLAVEATLMGWSGGCRRDVDAFSVHVNNIRAAVLSAMRQSYPRTRLLVGEATFSRAAVGMLRRSPPVSGDLAEYGAEFVEALGRQGASAAALDLATFEWHCDQVRRTPFQPPWCPRDAAKVEQREWPELVLMLRRDCMPVRFDHDIVRLMDDRSEHPAKASTKACAGDGCRYILVAGEYDTVAHAVSPQAFALASALVTARTFLSATEVAMRQFDDFEPFHALFSLLAIEALAMSAGPKAS
jgi:hypothetical protein